MPEQIHRQSRGLRWGAGGWRAAVADRRRPATGLVPSRHAAGAGWGGRARTDAGYALLEVVIAATILVIILAGAGIALTAQDATIGSVRNEQSGAAVLTKALAEVRAMPYEDVKLGLSNSDTTATGTSTYITVSGTTWTFKDTTESGAGNGETINHHTPSGSNPPKPFYPHVTSATTVNGVTYTVRAFPTQYKSGAVVVAGLYRVTVIVTWNLNGHGTPTTLVGQTLVFSGTSTCAALNVTTAPIAAPCNPNFTAAAGAGGGEIEILPVAGGGTPIQGMSFTSAELVLPGAYATSTSTQTSTVTGIEQASGAGITPGTTSQTLIHTFATTNLAQGGGTTQSATLTQASTAVSKTAVDGDVLTVTPSAGDSASSVSTVLANSGAGCKNFAGTTVVTTLPCASGSAKQAATASMTLKLYAGAESLGVLPLASVGATTTHPDQVATARYAAGVSTCPSTAASGCIFAAAQGGLGAVHLGGLPPQVLTDAKGPTGWSATNYLVALTGYTASATTWAKSSSTGHISAAGLEPISGADPQVSYYTATTKKYKTLTLTGGVQTLTLPAVTVTDTKVAGGTLTVTITATLTVGMKTTTPTTSATCVSACSDHETITSPVSGKVSYHVTQGATVLANFVMTVNLGSIYGAASFQKAT